MGPYEWNNYTNFVWMYHLSPYSRAGNLSIFEPTTKLLIFGCILAEIQQCDPWACLQQNNKKLWKNIEIWRVTFAEWPDQSRNTHIFGESQTTRRWRRRWPLYSNLISSSNWRVCLDIIMSRSWFLLLLLLIENVKISMAQNYAARKEIFVHINIYILIATKKPKRMKQNQKSKKMKRINFVRSDHFWPRNIRYCILIHLCLWTDACQHRQISI